jgi:hippurate hydrolase
MILHNDPVAATARDVVTWRHEIHARPELGFQEHATAAFVAAKLRAFGLEVHEGIAGTGVVGVLRRGKGPSIGLRAELDALPVAERSGVPYASRVEGVMHACGHDGHTAMLLGAARLLAADPGFAGTVNFVFQPAEENEGGGMRMIADGLLDRFPMEAVYAVHNWPGLPEGEIHARAGAMMAAVDMFELSFTGTGAHAAMPHLGDDPILAASEFALSVQRVVSRSVDPLVPLVVSLTQLHGGNVGNIVPGEVWLQGTCRFLEPGLSTRLEGRIRAIADGVAAAHGVTARLEYRVGYPPVVNDAAAVDHVAAAAREVVGAARVRTDFAPSLGCEDFAYLARAVGGAYVWVGNGPAGPGAGLHGDGYVFNDAIVPTVLRFWTALVRQGLPASGG